MFHKPQHADMLVFLYVIDSHISDVMEYESVPT
jgi:hypothetical protein